MVPETVSDLRIIVISAVLRRTKSGISILQSFFSFPLSCLDKQAMMKLVEDNENKDEQIQKLKEKLELATKDYKEVTQQINTLKNQTNDGAPSLYQQQQIQTMSATIEQDQVAMKVILNCLLGSWVQEA